LEVLSENNVSNLQYTGEKTALSYGIRSLELNLCRGYLRLLFGLVPDVGADYPGLRNLQVLWLARIIVSLILVGKLISRR